MPANQQISIQGDSLIISGEMTFSTVPDLWKNSQLIFPRQAAWNCDFSQVTSCDSAGLALLLEWLKFSKAQKKKIQFMNIPQQIWSIAAAAGLDAILKSREQK